MRGVGFHYEACHTRDGPDLCRAGSAPRPTPVGAGVNNNRNRADQGVKPESGGGALCECQCRRGQRDAMLDCRKCSIQASQARRTGGVHRFRGAAARSAARVRTVPGAVSGGAGAPLAG
ncbi:hypothetical protein GCM10009834_11840 [Streptomonospora arabica]